MMNVSSDDEVIGLYQDAAASYSSMMDDEIQSSLYSDVLDRLCQRIADTPGALVDTSCGSGHMLSMFRTRCDDGRELVGIDITPAMVSIAKRRLGESARIIVGDMRDLSALADGSAAAVLSFFALHHVDIDDVRNAAREWHRVLQPRGQLVVATWEGAGKIDYGAESDMIVYKHESGEISSLMEASGYSVDRCVADAVEDMGMNALYLEATRS